MKYLFPLLIVLTTHTQAQNPPKLIHFTPSTFYGAFTTRMPPALTIRSGDTVLTETIDAFGFDKNGEKRKGGGNPLTGPFYIEGAMPGDILAVTLNEVSLNRPYAFTSGTFASRSVPEQITAQFPKRAPTIRWRLDLRNNTGWPDSIKTPSESPQTFQPFPPGNLKNFKVPLHPFLGCIGVAPDNKKQEILSFFQGPFGGNLDYKKITTGTTVYLPVFHPGAWFFIGDGHAVQGDGEIAGNALETSLDVSFTINLLKGRTPLTYPRAEDDTHLMAMGSAKTLEQSLKIATAGLLDWLQTDYHLTLQEATQVMSTTIEYTIAEIADPGIVVVAKIPRVLLQPLPRHPTLGLTPRMAH